MGLFLALMMLLVDVTPDPRIRVADTLMKKIAADAVAHVLSDDYVCDDKIKIDSEMGKEAVEMIEAHSRGEEGLLPIHLISYVVTKLRILNKILNALYALSPIDIEVLNGADLTDNINDSRMSREIHGLRNYIAGFEAIAMAICGAISQDINELSESGPLENSPTESFVVFWGINARREVETGSSLLFNKVGKWSPVHFMFHSSRTNQLSYNSEFSAAILDMDQVSALRDGKIVTNNGKHFMLINCSDFSYLF